MENVYFLRIALPTPLRRYFDYLPPQHLDRKQLIPGLRVRVPFQSRTLIGVIVELTETTSVPYGKLKSVLDILDTNPILPNDIHELCQWAADYYHYPLGEVFMAALPALLRKGTAVPAEQSNGVFLEGSGAALPSKCKQKLRFCAALNQTKEFPRSSAGMTRKGKSIPLPKLLTPSTSVAEKSLALNSDQAVALNAILQAKDMFKTFLLDGVTGSGKTEVYLQAIQDCIARHKQVLVLVPEISLTPQTIARFRKRFNVPMVCLHSDMSDKERLQAWVLARDGIVNIVIGTRSAIFTPFSQLGLIIVDEEHDASFKQQDRFRYHARDLAIMRASTNQIPVVLGSATPSLESLLNVKRHRYQLLHLPERAGKAVMPVYQLVNVSQYKLEEGLSDPLREAMRSHLAEGNQVLLFLNRRGFAPVLYCTECAWTAECSRCDAKMVHHRKPARIHCHHCDMRKPIPLKCENCHKKSLVPLGIGTQRLEQTLQRYFPNIPVIRIDRDSVQRKEALEAMLAQVNEGKPAILIGTQMLAKGHHFSGVTLVGMVDADGGLFSADFRSAEQMGQLLVQVSGRAGRVEKQGTVLIQTRHPEHPLLQTLVNDGYRIYAQTLLAEREQFVLPPYSYFAVFRAEAYVEASAMQFLAAVKKMGEALTDAVTVLGPVPTIFGKRKGLHCQQLIVRANRRASLQGFLKGILSQIDKLSGTHPVKWVLDVDPVEGM